MAENENIANDLQLVLFRLGKETYAVDVNQVHVIVKVEDITHIPKMPPFIAGVMNLRGRITTIVDLKKRFKLDGGLDYTDESKIIVAEIGDNQIGIIVDSVSDVSTVNSSSISEPPKTISSKVEAQFITGICKMKKGLVMVLDITRILAGDELDEILEIETNKKIAEVN